MSPCCQGILCFGRATENVIKYDVYVKFPRFLHSVQICAKFCCKNFNDFAKYFKYYTIILRRAVFVDTLYSHKNFIFFLDRLSATG